MKKIAYLLVVISVVFTMFACNQDIEYPYEGRDRIHFRHFNVVNNKRVYIDSTAYSFGLKNDTIRKDTLKIVMELMGNISQTDRIFEFEIDSDSTDMIEGIHYEKIDFQQVLRAKRVRDTLRIIFLRDNLNSDYTKPVNNKMLLRLKENNDFALGLTKGHSMMITLNDFLSEPLWWNNNTGMGYFHPKKWRKLIEYNELYKDEKTCPFNVNNEGKVYMNRLLIYLNNTNVYDYIDGKKYRLEMYSMTLVNEN